VIDIIFGCLPVFIFVDAAKLELTLAFQKAAAGVLVVMMFSVPPLKRFFVLFLIKRCLKWSSA